MPKRKLEVPELANRGSLITYEDEGQNRCLGNLFHAKEHGVFDPTFGKVDVSPEDAATHNKLLDQALLDGLDTRCKIGQSGGPFYYDTSGKITTFTGLVVCERSLRHRNSLTVNRGDKVFMGELRGDLHAGNDVYLERVS